MANERTVRSMTFVFTDVEGSTRLWQDAAESMSAALPRHDELIASAVSAAGGTLVKSGSRGDSALAAFGRAADAIACVVELQRAFGAEDWPPDARLRVRSAVHTGEAEFRDDDYFGPTLNRAARLLSVAHGGQAVVSRATAEAVKDSAPPGIELHDLGEHVLKDLHRSERIFQVVAPGLEETFPALRSLDIVGHRLPTQLTSFVGRLDEVAEIGTLISEARMVTLTGVGGAGKTRLALQAAAEHSEMFEDGVAFVDLAPVRDPTTVPRTLVGALDVMDPAAESPTDDAEAAAARLTSHLVRTLKGRSMLLVTDNCEHVLDASSRLLGSLLVECPKLRVLATSREPIGIAGEHVYVVPPLAQESESVRLFCDRARAARVDFQLTDANADSIADICRKLDGIPLAIELAAARTKSLSPTQIADRLSESLGLLAASGRGGIERHRTLEGALEWSHATFEENEQVLFRRLAVFNGGWSLEGAEAVCGAPPLGRDEIVDLLDRLVDRSFVVVTDDGTGVRYRFLEPVRQFAERKLVERPAPATATGSCGRSETRRSSSIRARAASPSSCPRSITTAPRCAGRSTQATPTQRCGSRPDSTRCSSGWVTGPRPIAG
jgi:predicted ATPase/class 3 adenylate cyclase